MSAKNVLNLVLNHKRFDCVFNDVTSEEYLPFNLKWINRISDFWHGKSKIKYVIFHDGRGKNAMSCKFEIEKICLRVSCKRWPIFYLMFGKKIERHAKKVEGPRVDFGEPARDHFVLKLGQMVQFICVEGKQK